MKKIVISGSSSMQDKITYWKNYFTNKNLEVIDYPKKINKKNLLKELPNLYSNFYKSIDNTDILFLVNVDKNNIKGYIGANIFSELNYALIQNLNNNKNIKIYLLQKPSKELFCYDEIMNYLELGWIKLYSEGDYELFK